MTLGQLYSSETTDGSTGMDRQRQMLSTMVILNELPRVY